MGNTRVSVRLARLMLRGTRDAFSRLAASRWVAGSAKRRAQWSECLSQVSGRRCRHDSASNVCARSRHHRPDGRARARAWRGWWWRGWRRWWGGGGGVGGGGGGGEGGREAERVGGGEQGGGVGMVTAVSPRGTMMAPAG